MRVLRIILIVLSCLLLAAHFSRAGWTPLAMVCVALPLLLAWRRPLPAWTLRIALLLGAVEWLRTVMRLTARRIEAGEGWLRMAAILGLVTVLTFTAAGLVRVRAATARTVPAENGGSGSGAAGPEGLR